MNNDSETNNGQEPKTGQSRRSFLKKATYVAPTIVTLSAIPSFASAGSGYVKKDHDHDYQRGGYQGGFYDGKRWRKPGFQNKGFRRRRHW